VTDPGPVFAALADENRRRLLDLVAERGDATATELARELPVTRQAVAKHLAALEDAGLVTSCRAGRETRYRLAPGGLAGAAGWLAAAGAKWDTRLAELEDYLRRGGR
jgi:DNA-binding transcriptional ArsR family regulator